MDSDESRFESPTHGRGNWTRLRTAPDQGKRCVFYNDVVLSGQLSNHGAAVPAPDATPRRPNPRPQPPTARNRGLSPATVQLLVDAYLAGASIHGLARDLDLHRTTIDNCLKREGVKQPRRPVLSEADVDTAEAAYLAGDSWATIASRFGVDPATVGRLIVA